MLATLMDGSEELPVPRADRTARDSSFRERRRGAWLLAVLAGAFGTVGASARLQETPGNVFSSEELGLEVTFPDESWKLSDQSQGISKVLLFSPEEDPGTRCVILRLPAAALPQGMLTREEQVKHAAGPDYRRVRLEEEMLAARPAQCLEYAVGDYTLVREWGFEDRGAFVILQISSTPARWEDPATAEIFREIQASFAYAGGAALAAPGADSSTPEEIRALRRMHLLKPPRVFEVAHHSVRLRIRPEQHALHCTDVLTVRALQDGVDTLELYTTFVTVDDVQGPEGTTWESVPLDAGSGGTHVLRVRLAAPLAAQAELALTVTTSSADYYQAVDQELVVEVAVLGQVRARSSYSSHVVYYPIDEQNDASMDLTLVVPKGLTAVTGGELVEVSELADPEEGTLAVFHYRTEQRRPRILPFGFAVAEYVAETGTSGGGLRLTVYGYPGEEARIHERVEAAVEAANLLESMMGLLPWQDVRFAHVTPERKETGVSMPGFIVISDGFFGDLSAVDLSDGNLERRDVLGLLVVADELSHQWNIYAVPLPNELGEGISTFTNLLFVESRHGKEAWWRAVQYCQRAYLQARAMAKDVAIADPEIYQTTAYRGIVFCKTPAVLAMLRELLGDEPFFSAWRLAFAGFEGDEDGFEEMERAFTETAGEDLRWFFDQWFYRAGSPRLSVAFEARAGGAGVTVTQVQEGEPYRLTGVLRLTGANGEVHEETVELRETVTSLSLDCPFPPTAAAFDPDGHLLREIVPPEGS